LCGDENESLSDEYLISRVCEEFPCYGPAEAIEALENDVGGLIFKILDLRAYSKAKEIYDTTPMDKRPKSKLIDKVSEITMELAKERIAQAQAQEET
jgi:hypothetical protein